MTADPRLVLRKSGAGKLPRTVASDIFGETPVGRAEPDHGGSVLHQVLPIDHQCGEHRRLLQSGKPIASRRGRFRGSNGCGFNPRHPPSYQKNGGGCSQPFPSCV